MKTQFNITNITKEGKNIGEENNCDFYDEKFDSMAEIFEKLTPDKRDEVLEFMRFLRDGDKGDKNETQYNQDGQYN